MRPRRHEARPSDLRASITEAQVVRHLQKRGWSAFRTLKGPIDVIAAKHGIILVIQVKSGRSKESKAERTRMVRVASNYRANAEVWYEKLEESHGTKTTRFARKVIFSASQG